MELARARAWWRKSVILLATGFGCGLSPVASGTIGTLPGLLLMLVLQPIWQGTLVPITIAATLTLLAIPVCDLAEKHFGKKDDGRIVADEFLTFPIGLLGLPLEPWLVAVAFCANRFFDVWKPFPARSLQQLPGGWGIVMDDVFAALYSCALNHAIFALWLKTAA